MKLAFGVFSFNLGFKNFKNWKNFEKLKEKIFFSFFFLQNMFSNLHILQWLMKMPKLYFFAQIPLSHQAEKTTLIWKNYFFL